MLPLALFFLLALADDFRLGHLFLRRALLDLLLAHDGDRGDGRLGVGQDGDALPDLQVGDVQHFVDAQGRNIGVDRVGDEARPAAYLDLAQELFEDAAPFFHARRLAFEVQRHGDFDLLALHEAAQVRVDETALDRVNLPVEEQNLARADALHVEREDRVVARPGAQDGGQLPERRGRRHGLTAAAVDRQRHHAPRAQAARVVLAAARAQLRAHRYRFSLCHVYSQAFSNQPSAFSLLRNIVAQPLT